MQCDGWLSTRRPPPSDALAARSAWPVEDRRLRQGRAVAAFAGCGRDNRVAARRLAASARQWLTIRRATHLDATLVLIVVSMGGLSARVDG
jgi:hypothetical protein